MRIAVIGAGTVGLATAVGFSMKGHDVVVVDIDSKKIADLQRGLYPQGIWREDGTRMSPDCGKLTFTTAYADTLDSSIVFLCVGTPPSADGSADLSQILAAIEMISAQLDKMQHPCTIAIRSTIPPGTTTGVIAKRLDRLVSATLRNRISLAVNPEFLREGSSLSDFLHPYRIVIGADDEVARGALEKVYAGFAAPIVHVSCTTAEMIKYAANAYLAARLSFINEVGALCKSFGIDIYEVAHALGLDPRIGPHYMDAGLGFGGPCLPKDMSALAYVFRQRNVPCPVINGVIARNNMIPHLVVELVARRIGRIENKRIALLGISFKASSPKITASQALRVMDLLLDAGAQIVVYEPRLHEPESLRLPEGVDIAVSVPEALSGASMAVILTAHPEFKDCSLFVGIPVLETWRILDKCDGNLTHEGLYW